MKTSIITLFFALIFSISYSQSKPNFIIEQTNKGYDISLNIEDVSNLSAVKVTGVLIQNNYSKTIVLDLEIADVVNHKAFQSLGLNNSSAEFVVELTDAKGDKTVYPAMRINISEEMFVSK